MQIVRAGELTVRVRGPEGAPTVLLCHGFGAPGDDLVPLGEACDPEGRWRWVFPEGPLDLRAQGIPGRAWWPIDMVRLQQAMATGGALAMMDEIPEGLTPARALLEGAIDALGLPANALVVGGFSQGAMLATELALSAPQPYRGLAILSGALVARARWTAAAAAKGPALNVFQSHGRRDPILPFTGADALEAVLTGAGARVRRVNHGGGHELPGEVLSGLRAFLDERFA